MSLLEGIAKIARDNPGTREHLVPLIRRAQKELSSAAVRSAYYETSDGMYGLKEAVSREPEMKGDQKLAALMRILEKTVHDLNRHLTATYLWD